MMKAGVLFSGGKDSCLALFLAGKEHEIACLITIFSENKESYMFHTPNIELTKLQAEALNLPILIKETKGEKEKELIDLKLAIKEAKEKYKIEGIITGALYSNYQADRIKKICIELGLQCFNPLWHINQIEELKELVKLNFKVIISGVFAYPFTKDFLGKIIDEKVIEKLKKFQKEYEINPAGEGGEIETTVLDAPMFNKKIKILESETKYKDNAGIFIIKKARIEDKLEQSEETKEHIKISEKEIREGKTITFEELKKKMGIK